MLFLQTIRPEYPWYKKLLLFCYNWIAWFAPASYDAVADDVGDEYQSTITLIVIFGWLVTLAPWVALYLGVAASARLALVWSVGGYLLAGALYHFYERYGPYATRRPT